MKGGVYPSPIAGLSFMIRERHPFTVGMTGFSSRQMEISRPSSDFLPHIQASLNIRLRRLSNITVVQKNSIFTFLL